jgi:hypothetical protein
MANWKAQKKTIENASEEVKRNYDPPAPIDRKFFEARLYELNEAWGKHQIPVIFSTIKLYERLIKYLWG